MPELPEVETVRRGLQPAMEGSKILRRKPGGKICDFRSEDFVARSKARP